MKKILFTAILALGMSTATFAQSEKAKAKVEAKIERINNEIISSDKAIALTDEQKVSLTQIEFDKLKALRKAKKENASEEELKEIQKKFGKKIYKEVLTKEQRMARKKTRENNKG